MQQPFTFLFFILLATLTCTPETFAQQRDAKFQHVRDPVDFKNSIRLRPAEGLIENCGNNMDDDGNGLVDQDDFSCYFNSSNPGSCLPTKMIWATFSYGLYWVNLETNNDGIIPFPAGEVYHDIAWGPGGKLYGIEMNSGAIREIDPYTGKTAFKFDVKGYPYSNGLTIDGTGNFYLTSFTFFSVGHVVKVNGITGAVTVVADLSRYAMGGAGDLTFLNGLLYVTCDLSRLAKIDLANGSLTVQGTSVAVEGFGLVTLGDGYLYTSTEDLIYRIDPLSLTTTLYYKLPTYGYIYGMCAYSESCNAPGCQAQVKIEIQNNSPYCSQSGIVLKATGTGISGAFDYTWTLPGGTKKSGTDKLTVFEPGKYHVKYHAVSSGCEALDSIVPVFQQAPTISLGSDRIICSNQSISLQPGSAQDVENYLWQDGSTLPNLSTTQPGIYWLEVSNSCGKSRDSVLLTAKEKPAVFIGDDIISCPGILHSISNTITLQEGHQYHWSTGSGEKSVTVKQPGIYWLEASNECGIVRDSIEIIAESACTCHPIWPLVNLGAGKELCDYDSLWVINTLHSNEFRYVWQDGSHGKSFLAKEPGIYWVDVSTDCDTVRDTVIITKKPAGCDCMVYIPSAFTPNKDGKNDFFKPISDCAISGSMRIFNRGGQLVYTTNNLQRGWDGYFNGVLQPNDVYVYFITSNWPDRFSLQNQKGTFLLMR